MAEPNFEKGTMSYPVEYYLLDDGSWLLKNFIPFQYGPTWTHAATLLPFIKGFKPSDEVHPSEVPKLLERAASKCNIGFQLNMDYLDKLKNEEDQKEYEIWTEGFQFSASLVGKAHGKDFANAVGNFANDNAWFIPYYNAELMTFYGCKLFDNEKDARKKHG